MTSQSKKLAREKEAYRRQIDSLRTVAIDRYRLHRDSKGAIHDLKAEGTKYRNQLSVVYINPVLGNEQWQISYYQPALASFDSALTIAHETNNRYAEAELMSLMGELETGMIAYDRPKAISGHCKAALLYLEPALRFYREVGYPYYNAVILYNMSEVFRAKKEKEQQIATLREALVQSQIPRSALRAWLEPRIKYELSKLDPNFVDSFGQDSTGR